MTPGPLHAAAAALAMALLGGCGADTQPLQAWMDRERQAASAPALAPLEPAATVAAGPYGGEPGRDPFDARRLDPTAAAASAPSDAPTAADAQRLREPLEAFALESLRMVGSLARDGRTQALVQAPGAVFSVQVGDRLGLHGGRVTRITDTALTLRERVRDAAGGWTERSATLELQETAQ